MGKSDLPRFFILWYYDAKERTFEEGCKVRRCLAFLLLFLFCFPCVASQAEEEKKELTFQDVPWLSSPEEVNSILTKSGFISKAFKPQNIGHEMQAGGNYYRFSMFGYDADDPECPYTRSSEENPPLTKKLQRAWLVNNLPKTIAKQKIKSLSLFFTPDPKDRKLVECLLIFSARKKDDQNAILSALEDAYGDPTAVKTIKKKKNIYIWLGANNTIVMYTHDRESYVCFATLDGLALAESHDIVIPESEEPEDTGF